MYNIYIYVYVLICNMYRYVIYIETLHPRLDFSRMGQRGRLDNKPNPPHLPCAFI